MLPINFAYHSSLESTLPSVVSCVRARNTYTTEKLLEVYLNVKKSGSLFKAILLGQKGEGIVPYQSEGLMLSHGFPTTGVCYKANLKRWVAFLLYKSIRNQAMERKSFEYFNSLTLDCLYCLE